MLCPGTQNDCDNPGCRHGGCQGRLPALPLFQAIGPHQPDASAAAQTDASVRDALHQEPERIAA
jgi:hypothetical protein